MYLIDTDILIYSLKGRERVQEQFRMHAHQSKAISVVSYGELLYGARKSSSPTRNLSLVQGISETFPMLPVTPAVTEGFATVKAELELQGNRLEDFDLLIAATALTHNLVLVTNNQKHFSRVPGLDIENWNVSN